MSDTPILDSLDYLGRRQVTPKDLQKPLPTVLRKDERKKTKAEQEKAFRDAVWARDKSHSRASGRPFVRSHYNPEKAGEVHHVLARSTDPEKRLDPSNGLLLSRKEHALAEAMCPQAPPGQLLMLLDIEGPEDRGLPQTFIWRDVTGKELRRRVG